MVALWGEPVLTHHFDYELPPELIAQTPPEERDGGRLLVVSPSGALEDKLVKELPSLVEPGDLVVVNDSKVRPARVHCRRPVQPDGGGGRVELLFLADLGGGAWEALGRATRPLRPGDELEFPDGRGRVRIEDKRAQGSVIVRADFDLDTVLRDVGEMPLPPYVERPVHALDKERYQTVFAKELGSAAAPTAGLHLTEQLLGALEERGARVGRVTLHVGLGTFRPVQTEDLDDHPMHAEWLNVSGALVELIEDARARGARILAVGTTVVRALESSVDEEGRLQPGSRTTDLLIQPGYRFQVVDGLLTNFHMPRSTLIALVSAFAGLDRIKDAYAHAVRQRYRFFSYGDAMFLSRKDP